jgi:hypothetical protein
MNTATAQDFRLSSDRAASLASMGQAVAAWRKAQDKVRAYEAKHSKEAPQSYYRAMFRAEDWMRILGV